MSKIKDKNYQELYDKWQQQKEEFDNYEWTKIAKELKLNEKIAKHIIKRVTNNNGSIKLFSKVFCSDHCLEINEVKLLTDNEKKAIIVKERELTVNLIADVKVCVRGVSNQIINIKGMHCHLSLRDLETEVLIDILNKMIKTVSGEIQSPAIPF